jgi:ribonucleoside-diphosphate reductase alpha chain
MGNAVIDDVLPRAQCELGSEQIPDAQTNVPAVHTDHPATDAPPRAVRNRLPAERASVTHKFNVGGQEGYITVGLYPDRQPGELFITMAKEGSTLSGFINSFAQAISIGLQHGVPLRLYCEKFSHTRFEPSGWTGSPEIGYATSVMDYIFRWLQLRFGGYGPKLPSAPGCAPVKALAQAGFTAQESSDAPSCRICGSITKRNGACYVCANCGSTTGCS